MKKFSSIVIVIFITSITAFGQLSGPMSGTLGPGSFTVVGDISVEIGETLTILPGTELLHTGSYCWNIHGQLFVEGAEGDSVYFKRYMPNNYCRWRGLRFQQDATMPSSLNYCVIEHCYHVSSPLNVDGGAIRSLGVDLNVTNSRISDCSSFYDGGGIYAINAEIVIDNCIIVDNLASDGGNGGGINLENCTSAIIKNSIIARNSTTGT